MTDIRKAKQERYNGALYKGYLVRLLLVVLALFLAGLVSVAQPKVGWAQDCPSALDSADGGASADEACTFTDPSDDMGCCNAEEDNVVWAADPGGVGHSDDGRYYAQCVAMGGNNGDKWVSLDGTVLAGGCSSRDTVNSLTARPLLYCDGNNYNEYYGLCKEPDDCLNNGEISGGSICDGTGQCPILDVTTQMLDPANLLGDRFGGLLCNVLNYYNSSFSNIRTTTSPLQVVYCYPVPVDPLDPLIVDYEWVDITPDCSTGVTCPAADAGTWTEVTTVALDGTISTTWNYCKPGSYGTVYVYCDLDGDGVNDDLNGNGVIDSGDQQCTAGGTYQDGTLYNYAASCCSGGCGDPTWNLYEACEYGMGDPAWGEKAVASFNGVAYYCDGTGWEKFPDIEAVVNCPVPELGDEGLHPFADEEHVRSLEDAFYGIDPDTDEYIEPADGVVDQQGEGEGWLGPLYQFGEEMVENLMWQAFTIGTFFDAEQQLETQRTMQVLKAESHQRYKPDEQVCRFGTNVRGLVSSSAMAEVSTHNINQAMARREYGQENVPSAKGYPFDLEQRLWHFRNTYCDPMEANGAIDVVCDNGGGPPHRVNKDISFTRTVELPFTLDLDFTDTVVTEDEEDVLALGANLYAHRVFPEIPREYLKEEYVHDEIMDMRAVHALRSVARNSYAHITGMKTPGSGEVDQFMYPLLLEVGVPQTDLEAFLGENPSYFAQMEVLTRLIYQSPEFYSNLYTNSENVSRIGVALQAIDLMQDRDRYEAALRREVLVSLILEMGLRERQTELTTDTLQDLSVLYPILPY